MTTFKNNAKYAELLLTYLDVAYRLDNPLKVKEVLEIFRWRFKGGSLSNAAQSTRLKPYTSGEIYPDGLTEVMARDWPMSTDCLALKQLLANRMKQGKLRKRGVLARLGTYQMLTASYGLPMDRLDVYTGMRSIYYHFGAVWDWALKQKSRLGWSELESYTQELLIASGAISRVHIPTAVEAKAKYWEALDGSRVPGLIVVVYQIKEIIRMVGSAKARAVAKQMGLAEMAKWENDLEAHGKEGCSLSDPGEGNLYLSSPLGPMLVRVSQEVSVTGTGPVRFALGKSDLERLHQLVMSATSALIGVAAQSVVGTPAQKGKASLAVRVAEANIQRIVTSSRKVRLGDEVLVCKGYRRAYTAHLGRLAGPLCAEETRVLEAEAEETAEAGVLDIRGFLYDAMTLDAASSLNAAKMFKICPAPDVSPGYAMMDRIKQIGDGNIADPDVLEEFKVELRTQILRAYIRVPGERLKLRSEGRRPLWYSAYMHGKFEEVPSAEIHEYLAWEGTATMPDVSPYDPAHWKDSGLGADTVWEAENRPFLGHKSNMVTRLIFDDTCPMPGREVLNEEHVIKFFVKAEGHKDPARGIFSSNLTDRQAQSWMEKAVEVVARRHPSYMIGQEVDVKEAKVAELTSLPQANDWIPLFYSFDISGWSARMPDEPQVISHSLWAELYGGHLFSRAREINCNAYIYLSLDGYTGHYRNTHSNLEGFNGKEMTMVLIAMLSLSVKRWRRKVVEMGIVHRLIADITAPLLFAYIDDGLSRIDLPRNVAVPAFQVYKETVIETFSQCGFTVEVSKCFPSDRFAIFLNEVYLAGRHVVHGVRAAMAIGSEPTERHTSMVERIDSVATGVRGAVMAGLNPLSATMLMAYHVFLHVMEWLPERDPVVLAAWSVCPRSWGGLGLPNMLQLYASGSGAAFEEGTATLQAYARMNPCVAKYFVRLSKTDLEERSPMSVLTAPLSGRMVDGYMIDSRVPTAVRKALQDKMLEGVLSRYATRLLKYADMSNFVEYADAVVPTGEVEVLQEQMLINVAEAHPHSIFASFARRLEKSSTVMSIVGRDLFFQMVQRNRTEAKDSVAAAKRRMLH